jgi:tetratricopeptide (TPR) repeat protein
VIGFHYQPEYGQTHVVADEIFVGRRDELARFVAILGELPVSQRATTMRRSRHRLHKGTSTAATQSRVVLVHGLGGTGKSRLLTQFRGLVDGSISGSPVPVTRIRSIWLDWEDARRDQPGSYVGFEGPSLVTVLNALQKAVIEAFETDTRAVEWPHQAFFDYRQGAARMPEYAARFANVLTHSRQEGSPFTPQDALALLKSAASAGLVLGGHPGGILGLTPEQLAVSAEAGGHLSTAAARAVTGKKTGDVSPEEYALVTDPAGELTRRAAGALRALAGQTLLVVILDTGEVLGANAWGWLRSVMTHTGPRVTWVVGARFETEAEAGFDSPVARFVREIGDQHLVLMSPTRFDDQMIRTYLESRPKRPYTDRKPPETLTYTGKQIDLIARFTRGLPLAISLTAELLEHGQRVEDVCRELDDGYPSSVVSRLARRYLIHAEQRSYPADDPGSDDVTKILGLALAFGDLRSDPGLLGALWNVSDPLAAFQDLARRHDFVLPVSRRLHDDVRDTLRTDLLDPFRRAQAHEINQRAADLFDSRIRQIRGRWPTLDEQLDNTGFKTALLARLWHILWIDNQTGLDLFIEILPVLVIADPASAHTAAAIMDRFADTFDHAQRRDLDLLTGLRPASVLSELSFRRENPTAPDRRVKLTMQGLSLQPPCKGAADTTIGEPGDRRGAVMILQARLQPQNQAGMTEAVGKLKAAAAQTSSARLLHAIGSQAASMASELIWAGRGGRVVRTRTGLEAAQLATDILTGDVSTWQSYAVALRTLGRREEALAAYDKALTLDPDNANLYVGRGNALGDMGRAEEALAAYDKAVTLNPDKAFAYNARGNTLREMGRFEEALATLNKALTFDPDDTYAHMSRGIVLSDMGRAEEALAAYDKALTLDPDDAWAHRARGQTLRFMGRFEEALAADDKALTLAPDDTYVHRGWAQALRFMGRFEEALAALDKALTLAPYEAFTYIDRGRILGSIGRFEEALAANDKALALNPSLSWAYGNRGNMLMALGRYEEATKAYDKAIALSQEDSGLHENKGILLAVVSDLDGALAEFDTADRLAPKIGGEGRVWAGAILWHKRDNVRARDRFARVKGCVAGCTPFRIAEMEAIALCGLGQAKTAERHLRSALPMRFPGDQGGPATLYKLLSDPPLSGIDRLHKIVTATPDGQATA